MPISDFYASTVLKVGATFGFDHFACAPEEISDALGLQADETRTQGDMRRIGPRSVPVHFNSWCIVSTADSKDVNDHLRQLLARLGPVASRFHPEWGEPSFGVVWKGNYLYAGSGPFYEPDVIAGIAALGASLYQDIYQVDSEAGPTGGSTK